MLSPGPLVGGMEKQVSLQVNLLSQREELELTIIASAAYRDLFDESIQFVSIDATRSRRNPIFLWQISKTIKAIEPDIVHAHGHKAAQVCAALRSRLGDIRWLATAHGVKKNNKALFKMDHVVCVSQGVQAHIGGINTSVVNNGIDRGELPGLSKEAICARLNLDSSKPVLMALGRLAPVKRYDALVAAMDGLDANLVLVGDGSEQKKLEHIASPNVTFAGYQEDGRRWLTAADAMVVTSEREGFSLGMIEALQAETPILSTPVPVAVELLPKECIIEDIEAVALRRYLSQSIERLPEIKVKMKPVFKFAKTELTIEKNVENTLKVYQQVLSKV